MVVTGRPMMDVSVANVTNMSESELQELIKSARGAG
jgi:hypothetical protein